MKIYVDKMPEVAGQCLFCGSFHPYPPIVKELGYWECKLRLEKNNNHCILNEVTRECPYICELK